ncbi:3-oxoacyl-ACP synthase [Prescottella defluvii]|nr:3-oxoacyl-ACP synthase [Prescottella defluvii]
MSAGRSRRIGTISAAAGTLAVAGLLCAPPASATVTGQGDARNYGNSIMVTLQNVQSTTDAPAKCAILIRDKNDAPVVGHLMEIYNGGLGVFWTTMPNESLHLAGQYTDSADYRATAECRDADGAVQLVDTVVTIPEGDLVGNPPRYSELFGPF